MLVDLLDHALAGLVQNTEVTLAEANEPDQLERLARRALVAA